MIRQFISTETTGPFASIADSQKTFLILFRFNFQYGHYKSCGCLRFSFDKLETITSKVDIFDLRSETDEESFFGGSSFSSIISVVLENLSPL